MDLVLIPVIKIAQINYEKDSYDILQSSIARPLNDGLKDIL